MATTTKRAPGRPSQFTPALSARLAALLVAGHTVEAAARDVGVTPRTVERWRKRAYSTSDADRAFVQFEQCVLRGVLSVARHAQPRARDVRVVPLDALLRSVGGPLPPLREVLRDFDDDELLGL